jgi:hypothetical protein
VPLDLRALRFNDDLTIRVPKKRMWEPEQMMRRLGMGMRAGPAL